jgi:hypothetical protein
MNQRELVADGERLRRLKHHRHTQHRSRQNRWTHTRLQGGFQMVYDLSPGDIIQFGDGVTLTVLAVEFEQVYFGLESPESDCPDDGPDCQDDGL